MLAYWQMPPLPLKPIGDAKEAEKSKKHIGSASKALIGDDFHKDCRSLEKYGSSFVILCQNP